MPAPRRPRDSGGGGTVEQRRVPSLTRQPGREDEHEGGRPGAEPHESTLPAALRQAIDGVERQGRLILVQVESPPTDRSVVGKVLTYARQRGVRGLRVLCGPGDSCLDPWTAVVGRALPAGAARNASAGQSRFTRFAAVAAALEEATQASPMVVVLERATDADRSTLLFLEWIAQRIPACRLVVIAAYVGGSDSCRDAFAETLDELSREPACDLIRLRSPLRKAVARPLTGLFRRHGEYWTVEFDGQVAHLRDSKGLRYLAYLLYHPGQRVDVAALQRLGSGATELIPEAQAGPRVERTRLAVTKRLKSALVRLEAALPALGCHLRETVRRGYFCVYTPDPRCPLVWRG